METLTKGKQMKQQEKTLKTSIDAFLSFTPKEITEAEFQANKHNINIRLSGESKYYHAYQCALFTRNVMRYGYENITSKELQDKGVCFNKYSINNGYNQYCRDMQRFNNKEEMLGFVIGYNKAIDNMAINKVS